MGCLVATAIRHGAVVFYVLASNGTLLVVVPVASDSIILSPSMLKKLRAYDKYPTAPLATILHRALQRFTKDPKICWVKSHQDDKVYYDTTAIPLDY
jgi:hypothetical protein